MSEMVKRIQLPVHMELYRPACERILSWLSGEWVDQRRFDRLAFNDVMGGQPMRGSGSLMGAIMLPSVMGNQQDHLVLLQEMQRAGLVEAREAADGIQYRAVLKD